MGAYRRRIRLTPDGHTVEGELEDDFHHFGVVITHDGERVTAVEGDAVRFPWTTCPGAVAELAPLVGARLSARPTAVGEVMPARQNCTHLFDLAGLAVAHAARGADDLRQYDVTVPDRDEDGRSQVTLQRDGEQVLAWTVVWNRIEAPEPYAGRQLKGSFLAWAESELEPEEAEAAIVLRRACHISWGRAQDLDRYRAADELLEVMSGTCFTFQPDRAVAGHRVLGSIRDFTDAPDALLTD